MNPRHRAAIAHLVAECELYADLLEREEERHSPNLTMWAHATKDLQEAFKTASLALSGIGLNDDPAAAAERSYALESAGERKRSSDFTR